MERIKVCIWIAVLICLAYLVFFKPQPQRFILKEIHKKEKVALLTTENEGFIVFDTATGRIFKIETKVNIGGDSSVRTVESNLFLDPVHNIQVLRPEMNIKVLNGYKTGNNTTTMKL